MNKQSLLSNWGSENLKKLPNLENPSFLYPVMDYLSSAAGFSFMRKLRFYCRQSCIRESPEPFGLLVGDLRRPGHAYWFVRPTADYWRRDLVGRLLACFWFAVAWFEKFDPLGDYDFSLGVFGLRCWAGGRTCAPDCYPCTMSGGRLVVGRDWLGCGRSNLEVANAGTGGAGEDVDTGPAHEFVRRLRSCK